MLLKSYTKEIFWARMQPKLSISALYCALKSGYKRGTSQPECGEPTRMAEGVKGAKDCPPLSVENRKNFRNT